MSRWAVFLLVCCLPLTASGCRTWQPAEAEPEALFRTDPPQRIRVTRADGVRLTLERPEIRAGALVATASPGAVLLENVELVEVRGVSTIRTVGFFLPGAVLMALLGKAACRC